MLKCWLKFTVVAKHNNALPWYSRKREFGQQEGALTRISLRPRESIFFMTVVAVLLSHGLVLAGMPIVSPGCGYGLHERTLGGGTWPGMRETFRRTPYL